MENPIYLFKQAVTFGKGLTYSRGTHHVPTQVLTNPYFEQLQKAGLVVAAADGATGPAVPQSQIDIQKKAVDAQKAQGEKIAAEAAAKKAAAKAAAPTPAPSAPAAAAPAAKKSKS